MGIIGDKLTGGIQGAIKKGENKAKRYVSEITAQQSEIIEKVNWMMLTQQAICDKLGIKLKDPLEE